MNLRKRLTYKGVDCSGECKVLPPTFQGIKSLVERAGGNEEVVTTAFPPLNFVDDEEHSLVGEFVNELQTCDKVERVELVRQFDSYVKELTQQPDKHSDKQLDKLPVEQSDSKPSEDSASE